MDALMAGTHAAHRTPRLRGASARALLPACLLLSALLAACGGDDAPEPAGLPDPATILEGAATTMEAVRSLHFVLEHEDGTTEIVRGIAMSHAEGDLVAPDQMQATLEGGLGPVNFEVGVVIIGEDAWIQNPLTRRWEDEDITIDEVFDPREGVVGLVRSAQSPQVTDIEEVDGVESYRIEATLDSGDLTLLPGDPAPGREVPTVAWIGVEDQLVRRVELHGAVASGESEDLVRRLTLSRFDEDVSIVPPD
jgi:lipoprotein LprG